MAEIDALSPEKREQILRGAGLIFAQDGYEGASMSRIAHEAGVSKGTLYNHFDSKAALFAAYVRQACTLHLSHVFESIDGNTQVAATLREVAQRMTRMMLQPFAQAIYRVVVAEAGKFPELAEAFYNAGPATATRTLAGFLTEQTARGRLAVPDTDFAAEQFFALCQTRLWMRSKLHLLKEPTEAQIMQVVDAAVAMFMNTYGVRTDP